MRPRTHRGLIVATFAYVATLLSVPSPARAEDIDLFRVNQNSTAGRPNVLIILDNSANWSNTDDVYKAETGVSQAVSINVRQALADAIKGYKDSEGKFHPGIMESGAFNIGLMMFAETGSPNNNTDGGVIRLGMRHLDPNQNGPKIAQFFENVDSAHDKSNNTNIGLSLYEAYRYFTNGEPHAGNNKVKADYPHALPTDKDLDNDNPSLAYSNTLWDEKRLLADPAPLKRNALDAIDSKKYNGPMTDLCQKNFIIYLANGPVTDPNNRDTEALGFLNTVSSGNYTKSDVRITDPTYSADADTAESNSSDEWTRWLNSNDIRTDAGFEGKQSIVTYTIEVNRLTNLTGRRNTALLWSMAENGGGGRYIPVSSAKGPGELAEALNAIFAEILAVSSVFASVSLPASVNVRGTFLNQVYMGVFRPDANSSPRWAGNLKQYKLAVIGNTVQLADKNSQAVEDDSGASGIEKGLVKPTAVSFWTTDSTFWNTTFYPEAKSTSPKVPVTTSDSPDGQFVEKGGHAQRLREQFPTDLTGRKVYTCIGCSSGQDLTLSPDPSDPVFEFRESNTTITNTLLGITAPKPATSFVRDGTTVTATVANHGFTTGQSVTFGGAVETEYNVSATVTKVDDNTVRYQVTELPAVTATAASGSMTATRAGTSKPILSITLSGTTAIVSTQGGHGLNVNDIVTIDGTFSASTSAYKGGFTVTQVDDSQTFRFTVPTTPATPATSLTGAQATAGGTTKDIAALTRSGQTVTVTTSGNIFTGKSDTTGSVTITNVNPSTYDSSVSGPFTYTKLSNSSFTYQLPLSALGPADANPAPADATAALAQATATISSMTRAASSGNVSTVTVVTQAAHGFATGNTITIAGAAQTQYNGAQPSSSFTGGITVVDTTTFRFPLATQPSSPATTLTQLTATGSGGINRTALINWVRGANTQSADNPDNLATSIRGYLHGDVLHSRPVVINYNRNDPVDDRDIMVYYGANDGMIHAVKGGQADTDGTEKWTFVPQEFFNRFPRLYTESPIMSDAVPRTYFADGPVSANLIYGIDPTSPDPLKPIERLSASLGAKAQIFIGMRRGGRFYYALDVLDPDRPVFLWKIDNTMTDFRELGQSWSEMKLAKLRLDNCPATNAAGICRVLIFGGGYDAAANDTAIQGTATMGRAIFVVDAETGTLIWRAASTSAPGLGTSAADLPVSGMDYAIPADVTVIDSDIDVDKLHDRIYAADTGGNIWRANISDPDPTKWTVGKIAALGGTGANARRFLFGPDVVKLNATTDSVLIGSGNREQPFEKTVNNRFYMLKDDHALTAPAPLTPITENDLCPITVAVPDASSCLALATSKGWMFQFEPLLNGEKVVTGALTLAGVTVFSTNTPSSSSSGTCGNLGRALTYAINFDTGTPGIDWNGDGVFDSFTTEETRGGFLSTAVQFTGTVDGKPVETFIVAPRVYTPSGPAIGQRYRVFWNLSVD